MRAKNVIELLSLSANLYMLSRDEELMAQLEELKNAGKEKVDHWMHEFSNTSEEELRHKIMERARTAKEDLERKIEEIVIRMYDKMNIAHTNQISSLEVKIAELHKQLNLAELKISELENSLKK